MSTHANSLAALEHIKPKAPTKRQQVFEAILAASDGLTREEIAHVTGMSENTVRPRVRELIKAGRIMESGSRLTDSGQAAAILRECVPHQLSLMETKEVLK